MDSTKFLDDEPGLISAHDLAMDEEVADSTHETIAELAYSYWEARGRQGGSPWEDWFRAEQELRRRREL